MAVAIVQVVIFDKVVVAVVAAPTEVVVVREWEEGVPEVAVVVVASAA